MTRERRAAVLAAALTLLGPTAGAAKTGREGKPMKSEWRGSNAARAAEARVVVDEKEWRDVWKAVGQEPPPADFTRSVAVAVFLGQRMTGGYGVEFLPPEPRGDDVELRWREKTPQGFATQAITHPWAIKLLPRPKGRVLATPASPGGSRP